MNEEMKNEILKKGSETVALFLKNNAVCVLIPDALEKECEWYITGPDFFLEYSLVIVGVMHVRFDEIR